MSRLEVLLSIARVSSRPRVPVLRFYRESIDLRIRRCIPRLSQARASDERNTADMGAAVVGGIWNALGCFGSVKHPLKCM